MKISQAAAQLYTVRDFCKTAADLAETAKKIRTIGYEAVQVSGVGPIDPVEIRHIMEAAGPWSSAQPTRDRISSARSLKRRLKG